MVSILEGTLRDGASAGLLHERTYSTHGISLDFLAVVQKDSTNIRGIVLLVDPLTSAARADMLSTKTSTSPLFVSVESCQNAMVAASNSNAKMLFVFKPVWRGDSRLVPRRGAVFRCDDCSNSGD